MSRLDELIKELCPDGVEYIELKEVCNFQNGFAFKSSKFKDNGLPILRIANISDNMLTPNNYVYFDVNDYPNSFEQYKVNHGDVVVAMSGATTGKIGYNYSYNTYYLNQRVGLFVPDEKKLNKRYLFHWLVGQSERILNVSAGTGAQPNLSSQKMMGFMIQLPPLQVQEEIVKILDKFTDYVTELQAELQARKQQYEYYFDKMFPSVKDDDYEWVEIGSVGTVTKLAGYEFTKYVTYSESGEIIALRGLNVKNGHLVLDDVKYIDNSDLNMLNRSKLHIGDMLFTYVGTIGQVALVDTDNKYYLAPNVALIRIDEQKYMPEYMMYYFLTNRFKFEQISKLLQSSSMQNIPMEKIRKFKLPIISLEKQMQVVDVLRRLDVLCNDISTGLPAEIEARQKQYEYYRDKLLSFKEIES